MSGPIVLHDYWRSSAAYRVRIALNLKGVAYTSVPHDLRAGEQSDASYRAINPQMLVPAIEVDGAVLIQSSAILEWLEEVYPDPPLLPRDALARAHVRAMVAMIACDIHPLNNLRVMQALRGEYGADSDGVRAWAARWIAPGFDALERMIGQHGDGFAFGAAPTLADCYVVPQIYSAERYSVDLTPYPRVLAVAEAAAGLPALAAAHPDAHPDADRA